MDKLQKVLNEVERLQNELIKEKKKGYGSDVDDACILELQNIKNYIKFVQEEPVSEDLEEEIHKEVIKLHTSPCYDELKAFALHFIEWQKEQMMANTADAMIGLPYENKDGGYTHLIDVSRPLPVGNNKIAIIFKEE